MPNAAWSMKNESSEIPTSNSPRKTGIEMRTDFRFQLRSQAVSSETLVAGWRILGQIESKTGTEILGWALMSRVSLPGCIALFCAGLSVQTVHACCIQAPGQLGPFEKLGVWCCSGWPRGY